MNLEPKLMMAYLNRSSDDSHNHLDKHVYLLQEDDDYMMQDNLILTDHWEPAMFILLFFIFRNNFSVLSAIYGNVCNKTLIFLN